jgi:hypothetical protein
MPLASIHILLKPSKCRKFKMRGIIRDQHSINWIIKRRNSHVKNQDLFIDGYDKPNDTGMEVSIPEIMARKV